MDNVAAVLTATILLVGTFGTWAGWKVGRSMGFEDGWEAGRKAEQARVRRITTLDERDTAPRPGARGHAVVRPADFRDVYLTPEEPKL